MDIHSVLKESCLTQRAKQLTVETNTTPWSGQPSKGKVHVNTALGLKGNTLTPDCQAPKWLVGFFNEPILKLPAKEWNREPNVSPGGGVSCPPRWKQSKHKWPHWRPIPGTQIWTSGVQAHVPESTLNFRPNVPNIQPDARLSKINQLLK